MSRVGIGFVLALVMGMVATADGAQAAGCLSGAAVGGVAGHVAGHHALLGAAAGCAIGHHQAARRNRDRAAAQRNQNDPAPGTPTQ